VHSDLKTDDEKIVELYLNRDEKAIRETEKKYASFIFAICDGILHRKSDSEECVNSVFLKLWNTIPPQNPKNLKAYVARLARTTATDRYRFEKREKRNVGVVDSLDDYSDFFASEDAAFDDLAATELKNLLNSFLNELSERDRICFLKRYYFCCTVGEIVKQMRISKSTVYLILDDVKKRLKEKMLKEGFL